MVSVRTYRLSVLPLCCTGVLNKDRMLACGEFVRYRYRCSWISPQGSKSQATRQLNPNSLGLVNNADTGTYVLARSWAKNQTCIRVFCWRYCGRMRKNPNIAMHIPVQATCNFHRETLKTIIFKFVCGKNGRRLFKRFATQFWLFYKVLKLCFDFDFANGAW